MSHFGSRSTLRETERAQTQRCRRTACVRERGRLSLLTSERPVQDIAPVSEFLGASPLRKKDGNDTESFISVSAAHLLHSHSLHDADLPLFRQSACAALTCTRFWDSQ